MTPDALPPPFLHPGTGSGAELWLVRHAEVREDWQGRAYGDLDVPLSLAGEERTRALAPLLAALGPTRVLASPLSRARLLGAAVARCAGLELELDDNLREVHRGRWQGRAVRELQEELPEEVAAFYADPWAWRGHGGECDRDVSERAWRAVERGLADGAGARLCVATHYNVIRVLAAGALGIPAAASFAFRVDPGRASLLVDRADGWHLLRSNVETPSPPRVVSEVLP